MSEIKHGHGTGIGTSSRTRCLRLGSDYQHQIIQRQDLVVRLCERGSVHEADAEVFAPVVAVVLVVVLVFAVSRERAAFPPQEYCRCQRDNAARSSSHAFPIYIFRRQKTKKEFTQQKATLLIIIFRHCSFFSFFAARECELVGICRTGMILHSTTNLPKHTIPVSSAPPTKSSISHAYKSPSRQGKVFDAR